MRVTGREDESPRSRSACLLLAMAEITETFPYSHLLRHGYDVRELTNGCSTASEEPRVLVLDLVP